MQIYFRFSGATVVRYLVVVVVKVIQEGELERIRNLSNGKGLREPLWEGPLRCYIPVHRRALMGEI